MIGIYILLALFIAWIWVDYFRLIDVFEKENLLRVGVTFAMGAASVLVVFGINDIWPKPFSLEMNGSLFNDFLYCTFSIGLIEEFSKFLPVIIAILIFRKHINEPIDYVSTFSVAALGFAAAENALYFSRYGADLISSRAILSNVGHMLFASLTAYGLIVVKFRNVKPGVLIVPVFLLLAAIFHGLYDLGLMYEDAGWIGAICTILLFFMGVSVFATILNNALNISPFFSYKHVIDSSGVALRMLVYYAVLFAAQCLLVFIFSDFTTVFQLVRQHAWTILPVVLITVIRLSRFKLIKDRWNTLKPELPFSISFRNDTNSGSILGVHIGIKGDPYSEYGVNVYYDSYVLLCPIREDSTYLGNCRKAFIYKKIYINGDVAHYGVKIFTDETLQQFQLALLQIKRNGTTSVNNFPLVAILEVENPDQLETTNAHVKTSFIEWAMVKPGPSPSAAGV